MGKEFRDQAWVGWRVKKSIYTVHETLLLPEMTVLTEGHLEGLKNHQIQLTENDVEYVASGYEEWVETAVAEIKGIFLHARNKDSIPLQDVKEKVVPQIQKLAASPRIVELLRQLRQKDNYTYQHSVAVGVLASVIGNWMRLSDEEMAELTLAAALHDIGKAKIPAEVLNKPGELTGKEFDLIKRHTVYGHDLIGRSMPRSERIARVALQHHERDDRSGYPARLGGGEIDLLSKIVAVADVFHALASDRVYRSSTPFYQILRQMSDHAFGALDPVIVSLFVQKLMESLIGNRVLLSSGKKAEVVFVHPHDPSNPIVKTDSSFIDLSKWPELHIDSLA